MRPEGAWGAALALSVALAGCGQDVLVHERAGDETAPYPVTPPATICDGPELLAGPPAALAGAVVVPAGDNSELDFSRPDTTYWFAPGVHTLGDTADGHIAPGDNSTFIGAPGAILEGQRVNTYAFGDHAVNVRVAYLEVRGFACPDDEGVVNHDGGTGWLLEHLYVHDNGGAGVFISSYGTLRDCCLRDNSQYGFQGIGPGGGGAGVDLVIDHNEISGNGTGGKLWNVAGATITASWFHDSLDQGIAGDKDSRDFVIERNLFEDNWGEAIYYGTSYNAVIRANAFLRNALGEGAALAAREDPFPVATIFVSESGGDSRVAGPPVLDIVDNYFEDNWGGVVLWEDPDRFCGSPDVYVTRYCTIVSAEATLETCVAPAIAEAPLRDDCRWKTQHVSVRGNELRVSPEAIGCTDGWCGKQGLLSRVGTAPSWSPYLGEGVAAAVTFDQGNVFEANRYVGPWRFIAHDSAVVLDFAAWRAAPYGQDAASTLE